MFTNKGTLSTLSVDVEQVETFLLIVITIFRHTSLLFKSSMNHQFFSKVYNLITFNNLCN